MSKHAWILVADSARARIFSVDGATAPLNPIEQLVHPESRLHDRDIKSDRPGRAFDSEGKGRHANETSVSPKAQEAIRFAGEVAAYLNRGRVEGKYQHLVVVADPRFLGTLRSSFAPEVKKLVSLEVDKDLSKASEPEIRKALPERI